jgi:hypothetical protein
MNADLRTFVREALARGASPEQLRHALREARWADPQIEAALAEWHDAGLGVPVPRRRIALSPREAFLYLLMFVALHMVAYHTGAVLFALIGRAWPDPMLLNEQSVAFMREQVRFSVASLLVAFPVFLFTSRLVGGAITREPEKRDSGVRRWLTYLTLFNGACVLIGDFIAVVLGALKGELVTPFVAKAVVVGAIAGWLFLHYLGGMQRDESDTPRAPRSALLPRLAAAVVVLAVGLGLWLSGAPAVARQEQFDRQRLQDLSRLSTELLAHRGATGTLPNDLAAWVRESRSGTGLRAWDPETRAPYVYETVSADSFVLGATFARPDSIAPTGTGVSPFWSHGAGPARFGFAHHAADEGKGPKPR